MEAFLTGMQTQLGNVFNIYAMKHVNTGDRILDTSIQVILSTLIGGILTVLVNMYMKDQWKEYLNRIRSIMKPVNYNPLEFNPALAPEKPANGTEFTYYYNSFAYSRAFLNGWFTKHCSHKRYNLKNLKTIKDGGLPIRIPMPSLDMDKWSDVEGISMSVSQPVPVWRSRNGAYVFYESKGGDSPIFQSDCPNALRECVEHFIAYAEKLDATRVIKQGQQPIYHWDAKDNAPTGGSQLVHSARTFDKLFFTEKKSFLGVLDKFKAKTLYPSHLPVENKLGILLHGPPGTGKSAFIAALSNYLQRPILMVYMNQITTRKQFDKLLDNIFRHSCIFVLEEIDCMSSILRRESDEKESESKDSHPSMPFPMYLMAEKAKSDSLMEAYKEERAAAMDKLDLGYILTKLDGLESGEGRVIIATTNHPERIDPALTRPGRLGYKLNLTNCTREMLVDILTFVFQMSDETRAKIQEDVQDIQDELWSPTELMQMCVSLGSYEKVIEHIHEHEPCMM